MMMRVSRIPRHPRFISGAEETVHDIQPIIDRALQVLETHRLDRTGAYARWIWQDAAGGRELGLNEYGCADAANILYMVGAFPCDPVERQAWIDTLQGFQNPATGLFTEATHHPYHTTAHCIAALELFDARPRHPLTALHRYLDQDELYRFLDGLHWQDDPWIASHQGAGIYAALVLAGEAPRAWQDWYFAWLYEEADPATGFWRKGHVVPTCQGDSFSGTLAEPTVFPHLAASFHYLFNHEYAHRPLHYPAQAVETCLDIYANRRWPTLGHAVTFAEVDWVYTLNRAQRQAGTRFTETKDALRAFADEYVGFLLKLDPETHENFNDLHTLFGCICALAELQAALPGYLASDKPLKLVLDRRPFI